MKLYLFIYFYLLPYANSFFMALKPVNTRQNLASVNACPKKVTLFTSDSCRACAHFQKKIDTWSKEFENIEMFKIRLNVVSMDNDIRNDIMKYCYEQNVKMIPYVIIDNDGCITRLSGVPRNYEAILNTIKGLEK